MLTTTKVLAVAFASAACGRPDGHPDSGAVSASAVAPPSGSPAAMVVRDAAADPGLLALQSELIATPRADVLKNMPRFRPLCDKDGYPLVGNLNQKAQVSGMEASEFCAEVRKKPGA
ncbi:MAG: hypothetical protein ACHREM_32375 [Polyangiales bacterium]